MGPKELLKKIKTLKNDAPITKKFEKALNEAGRWDFKREEKKRHKNNQKIHWELWLEEYDGPGFYKRKNWENITAKMIYNRISCPPMLVWLCEASGVSKVKIMSAEKYALEANPAYSSMCSAIRKVISWEEVEEHLLSKK